MSGVKIHISVIKLATSPLQVNSVGQNGADGHSGTIRVAAALHFSRCLITQGTK